MNGKKIYDSIHGFIHLDPLESDFIHSYVFQRLHHIHQLGIAYLVYPGGTHKRFEHSLGVMHLASEIYDHLILASYETTRLPEFHKVLTKFRPEFMDAEYEYWRRILRFAALCHDIGHLPFSHSAEKVLLGENGHEMWSANIIQSEYLLPYFERFLEDFPNKNIQEITDDVLKTAIGEEKAKVLGLNLTYTPWEKIISEIITADFFGADRIDYLLRDAQYTGISYGVFDYHQLIERLRILPTSQLSSEPQLKLGIEEGGLESCEALLMSRYFMHKRICHYSTVRAYTWHLKRFMRFVYSNHPFLSDLDEYLEMTEYKILTELHNATKDEHHPGHNDAKSIFFHENRCKAISLPTPVNQEKLKEALSGIELPEDQISWEINSYENDYLMGLDFPVLKKDGKIHPCHQLSKISVPIASSNWLYVPSKYEMTVRQKLGSEE